MKKHLLNSVLALAVTAATAFSGTVTAFAGTGSTVSGSGVVGRAYIDFESYDVDTVFTAEQAIGTNSKLSLYKGANFTYSIADDNGNKVLKMVKKAGVGGLYGFKLLLNTWSEMENVNYWIIKYNLKNGDSAANYNPWIAHHGEFRDDAESISFNGSQKINAYDWNEYIFIGNKTTGRIRLILNGRDCGEVASVRIANPDNYYGLQVYDNETKAWEQVMYADDIEIYGFNFDISCDFADNDSVVPTDTIALNVKGYIDEDSFDTIKLTSDKDSDIAISERNYDAESGILTLTLNKELDDFTSYTVDYSDVCAKIGGMKLGKNASFKTTGDIVLTSAVTVNGADRLTAGVNEVTLNAVNTTDTPAALCMITELIKDGKTVNMSYKNVVLPYNGSENLRVSYQLDDDNAVIKAYVKNAVNGTVYYGEEFTVTKNGTTGIVPENITEKYPVVNSSEDIGFYSLILGEEGSRSKLEALKKEGLVDCTADVGSQESVLIAVVKKDGRLADAAYTKGTGVLHTVLNVEDKNSVVEMYVWSDIYGTDSRMEKAVLAAE